ncbi:short chain dehydrogenase [Apiospora rasikravindrae]|uniref:Short chain dehydrogenase n=1 Tax=Apiospora rasikravindrae TaxID=990691 RepID=A0ABR1T114_9PEZI
MPSYVITGVSKGLGFEFLRQISSDPNNTVVGIVRDKPRTEKRVAEELSGRSNITILEADITVYDQIKKASEDAAPILGGKLDYLIANAGYVSMYDNSHGIGTLGTQNPLETQQDLQKSMETNVYANIHLYNLFMPLILQGDAKKVICISSGLGDPDLAAQYDLDVAALYAISKAAMNMATAKFSAQHRKDGVLFLSLCPGMVDVGRYNNVTPEQQAGLGRLMQSFKEYAPHFEKPATPEEAIRDVIKVWETSSIENGNGGAFLSHKGNKQWL